MNTAMTTDITYTGLPILLYENDRNPDELHAEFAEALRQGPVALGPYGPEVLGYDLVRTVFRDSRFVIPKGIGLTMQGITSGPVWDRVTRQLLNLDGAEHHRLRRLVAKAFTPRAAERMRSACVDVITELVDKHIPKAFSLDVAAQAPAIVRGWQKLEA